MYTLKTKLFQMFQTKNNNLVVICVPIFHEFNNSPIVFMYVTNVFRLNISIFIDYCSNKGIIEYYLVSCQNCSWSNESEPIDPTIYWINHLNLSTRTIVSIATILHMLIDGLKTRSSRSVLWKKRNLNVFVLGSSKGAVGALLFIKRYNFQRVWIYITLSCFWEWKRRK